MQNRMGMSKTQIYDLDWWVYGLNAYWYYKEASMEDMKARQGNTTMIVSYWTMV